jgi:hypothetical protein
MTMTGYRKFMALIKKEIRFFRGPALVLIGLLMTKWVLISLIRVIDPTNVSFQHFIRPLLLLMRPIGYTFLFCTVFAYGLIAEHLGKTRVQLESLPVRSFLPLAAKIMAIFGWFGMFTAAYFMAVLVYIHLPQMFDLEPLADPSLIYGALYTNSTRMLMQAVALIGLITAGYALAVAVGRLHVLIGSAVFIGGYTMFLSLYTAAQRNYYFPLLPIPDPQNGLPLAVIGDNMLSHVSFAVLLTSVVVIPALILYERYREV